MPDMLKFSVQLLLTDGIKARDMTGWNGILNRDRLTSSTAIFKVEGANDKENYLLPYPLKMSVT